MNLIESFFNLSATNVEGTYTAGPIDGFPNYRIAADHEGNPVLLLSSSNKIHNTALKNFRLKYLQLERNIECKVTEGKQAYFKTFTVLTFKSSDRNLQEYFLRISETLIKTLGPQPTQEQIIHALNKLVEVFRSLTDAPSKTVQGLWSELFFINSCKDPKIVLNYWHSKPEEKFDFNAGSERIEIKSNSHFDRIHYFSNEQLNPPTGCQVIVASLFTKPSASGMSIQDLLANIVEKIPNDYDAASKLNTIVFQTLGNSLEHTIGTKYDYHVASDSLRFYLHQDISKIEAVYVPNEVSEVKYKSNLNELNHIDPSQFGNKLFFAVN
jgi:hypothetical protein